VPIFMRILKLLPKGKHRNIKQAKQRVREMDAKELKAFEKELNKIDPKDYDPGEDMAKAVEEMQKETERMKPKLLQGGKKKR